MSGMDLRLCLKMTTAFQVRRVGMETTNIHVCDLQCVGPFVGTVVHKQSMQRPQVLAWLHLSCDSLACGAEYNWAQHSGYKYYNGSECRNLDRSTVRIRMSTVNSAAGCNWQRKRKKKKKESGSSTSPQKGHQPDHLHY